MTLLWFSLSLFGFGLFILTFRLVSALVDAVSWTLFRPRRQSIALLRSARESGGAVKVVPDDLLGLAKIPWMQIYILSLAASLGLYIFTQQALMLFLAFIPFAVRAWLTGYRKRQLNADVLAFLTDLRLAMPLQGSLLRALQDVAGRGGTRLAGITARYLQGGFSGSGLELLEQLAGSTKVPYLVDLVAWTKAAEEGTLAADAPFEHALARLQAEAYTTARENMQRIPTRLTLFVLPALLGPAIVVLLYPVVARLLAQMGGTGWGGGY